MIRAIAAAVGTLALSACSPGKAALPVGATAPDFTTQATLAGIKF